MSDPISPRIYQIYYSPETQASLDPGFYALDNLANERPDWREYWPIRRFLINHPLDGNEFVGFFSPKFREKTGLIAGEVQAIIASQPADTDVVLFSPFFDQIATYWNIFEHGMNHHPGIFETFKLAANLLAPGVVLETLVSDSSNTVFSNFFVAKPAFWREWLANNEILFAIAEDGTTDLGKRLNMPVKYGKQEIPAKVFMMERVATLLLATGRAWRVRARDPLLIPIDSLYQRYRLELICMDALKIAYSLRGVEEYREVYRLIRQQMVERSKANYEAKGKR